MSRTTETEAAPPARSDRARRLRFWILCAFVGGGLAASVCGFGAWYYGSLVAFSAALRGESFAVTPATIDLGNVTIGDERVVAFSVRNLSSAPIRVVGAQTNCTCVAIDNLPLSVASGDERQISVRVHVNRPDYSEQIAFHVDHGAVETRFTSVSAIGAK